jgi:hypothetical protein
MTTDTNGHLTGEVVGERRLGGSLREVDTAFTVLAYIGQCDYCLRPVRVDTYPEDHGLHHVIQCPDCGRDLVGDRLAAKYTDQVCAEVCMMAHSNICNCSCAGPNHARLWGMRIGAEELTEEEVRMQQRGLQKYYTHQLAALDREEKKLKEGTVMRENAFESWAASHEGFIRDVIRCDHPEMVPFKAMIENDTPLTSDQESQARGILARSNF